MRERLDVKGVFLTESVGATMSRAIVLTVAAVLCGVLTKRGRRDHPRAPLDNYASRDSFEKSQVSANNLKAAVKKVDNSAAAVEVALKGLMAA
jgi:hypothetical protein